jgi:hypothetical protein
MRLHNYIFGILLAALMPTYVWATNNSCVLEASYTSTSAKILMGPVPSEQLESFADRLTELSACQIKTSVYPLARLWFMYHHKQLPIVFGALRTSDRDATGLFFEMLQAPIFWVSLESAPQVKSLTEIRQLPNFLLGNVRGMEMSPATTQFTQMVRQSNQVDESVDSSVLLKKIRRGRVSGAFLNQLMVLDLVKNQQVQGLRTTLITDLGQSSAGVYINPSMLSPDEYQRLRRALKQLQTERYMEQLISKRSNK